MARQRVRLAFRKDGNLRFIGHMDLLRLMQRLFRRAQLPVAMSEGFHPKQRISYVSALGLGYASEDEIMEVLFAEEVETSVILTRLAEVTVPGLDFVRAEILPEGGKKSAAVSFLYEVTIPEGMTEGLAEKTAALWAADSVPVQKANGKTADLRPGLMSLEWTDSRTIQVRFAVRSGPEATVRELLVYLGLEGELFRTIFPRRLETALA